MEMFHEWVIEPGLKPNHEILFFWNFCTFSWELKNQVCLTTVFGLNVTSCNIDDW